MSSMARQGAYLATIYCEISMLGLGTRLRIARMSAGMTIRELASALGVCHSTLGHWETGRHEPAYRMLHRIAVMTGADALWVFTGVGNAPVKTGKRRVQQEGVIILDPDSLSKVDGGYRVQPNLLGGYPSAWEGVGSARIFWHF
ncbi:helix-turn-helix transcriptional regulator [Pseudoxanthomonas putridarboris]|uniref:Helix-turn-helix transcriptional regulator n=1 Tax=Pseudoxanthomonas putridarboris TaxID=752605 RepID=A0ABU9IW02_9GAMM